MHLNIEDVTSTKLTSTSPQIISLMDLERLRDAIVSSMKNPTSLGRARGRPGTRRQTDGSFPASQPVICAELHEIRYRRRPESEISGGDEAPYLVLGGNKRSHCPLSLFA